jgi:hypothetical protein
MTVMNASTDVSVRDSYKDVTVSDALTAAFRN